MSKFICPNCGSNNLALEVTTKANFHINKDGSIGEVMTDKDSIEKIRDFASEYETEGEVFFFCPDCHHRFEAWSHMNPNMQETGKLKWLWKIGDDLG